MLRTPRRAAIVIAALLVVLTAPLAPTPAGAELVGTELITTIAGNDDRIRGTEGDGPAIGASLDRPRGVAVAPNGDIYIADSANNRIRVIPAGTDQIATIAGTLDGSSGTGPDGSALGNALFRPETIAVDNAGNLYIADTSNHRIRMIPAGSTTIVTVAGSVDGISGSGGGDGPALGANLAYPRGIAVDDAGNLYIADTSNNRIRMVAAGSGQITTIVGNGNSGDGPGGDGPALGSVLGSPEGLALDDDGHLYIADTLNQRIRRVDLAAGTITTVAGNDDGVSGVGGDGPAIGETLSYPRDVAVDSSGNLYIVDNGNRRIRRVLAGSDQIATIAGNDEGLSGAGGDGPAIGSLFNAPRGVDVDDDGNVYIVDTNNHRIRMVVADTAGPTIDITGITDGAVITDGDNVQLGFTCTDVGTSGVDTCTATLDGVAISSGTSLDTADSGEHTIVITAVDLAGNTTTETIAYTVLGNRQLTGDYANTSGTNGRVARLYMAIFNRQPDSGGYEFWVGTQSDGTWSSRRMVAHFITSPEFNDTYGDLTDTDFIVQLYRNVLLRSGDPQGLAFWNTQITNGMTRADIVLHFSESPEFKTLTGTS